MKRKKTAFTLIEMLIVIVIIGILASALVPRLISIQTRARDTKRKVDLRQIANGIAIFYNDNGRLPTYKPHTSCGGFYSVTANSTGTCGGQWLTTDTWFYSIMTTVPVDPANRGEEHAVYYSGNNMYTYLNGTGGTYFTPDKDYLLATQLENPSDPDRCFAKPYYYKHSYAATGQPWCPPHAWNLWRSQMIYMADN